MEFLYEEILQEQRVMSQGSNMVSAEDILSILKTVGVSVVKSDREKL